MPDSLASRLSRRERQIMDVLYQLGEATAAEVQDRLPEPPGYSAVRAMLRILEEKGHVGHYEDGPRYVFTPTLEREAASRSAVTHLLKTFFNGSVEQAMAALLDGADRTLSREEIDRLARLIEQRKIEDERDER
jgi:BlaI family penicillinase repressor